MFGVIEVKFRRNVGTSFLIGLVFSFKFFIDDFIVVVIFVVVGFIKVDQCC